MAKELPGNSIHELYQRVHKNLIKLIRSELEPYDFSRGEFPLLFKLIKKGDGLTQKEICEKLHVSKSTTSKIIKSLVKKGYLRKEKDLEDKRASRIFLTDKKDEIEDLIKEIDEKAENKMLKGFDAEEKSDLRDYLERILENLAS
ncbi:MAG: MarR family transcriptional regulator [Candidatus Thermoplasmatota archaeon]|nr:MarR family transcriptional regulator [Candidatus Thermoplasmatota archaeon]MBS3789529.1 MarR family transcriptional regulator [Candidatus Thermoplasmatota archaeon]